MYNGWMENSNKRNYIIGFWVVVILLAGFLVWKSYGRQMPQNTAQDATGTTTPDGSVNAGLPPGGITVVEPKPQKVSVPAPTLTYSKADFSAVDPQVVAVMTAKMDVTIANLKKDPTSFQDWIDLGFDRKTLGDYGGAAADWEYVSLLYPQNLIAFGNLGDLYANFLHNNAKAEAYYQTAIKNSPQNIDYYRNLFTLYISENKNSQAVALLEDGLAKNPKNPDLELLLSNYQKGQY